MLAAVLAAAGSTASLAGDATYGAPPAGLAEKLEQLRLAYPDTVAGTQGNELVLKDGTRLAISDGRTDKSFDELLNAPDVDDMFAFAYPAGAAAAAPPAISIRAASASRRCSGRCTAIAARARLAKTRKVPWVPKHGGGSVTFTTAQGADKALEAVSEELDRLPASFTKYLAPSAGTYNCRAIAGTERMSMHAYAAAIDINTKQTTYWQWVKPGADGLYHWSNKIPPEIVAAFEKHGFIWGGRWYHFDTMHFEYRPELLPRR